MNKIDLAILCNQHPPFSNMKYKIEVTNMDIENFNWQKYYDFITKEALNSICYTIYSPKTLADVTFTNFWFTDARDADHFEKWFLYGGGNLTDRICINYGCFNKRMEQSNGSYRTVCASCHKASYSGTPYPGNKIPYKKTYCECCKEDFPSCCLDMDHKDGNSLNQRHSNVWTLCKNCHTMKSKIFGDSKKSWGGPHTRVEAIQAANKIVTETPSSRKKVTRILHTCRHKWWR